MNCIVAFGAKIEAEPCILLDYDSGMDRNIVEFWAHIQNVSSTKRLQTRRLYTQRLLNKTSPWRKVSCNKAFPRQNVSSTKHPIQQKLE
jgi:hypothetical protein